jgi:toxin ParE1/3/4
MSAPNRPLILSRRARNDLRNIQAYTLEQWGEQQWAEYEEALSRALAAIAAHSEIGRPRPELGTDIRSHAVREHVILYQVGATRIQVLRVRHSRSDPRRALR